MPLDFAVSPALDPAALAAVFARFGRMHLPEVLPDATARALHASLEAEVPWRRSLNAGGGNLALPVEAFDAQPAAWREEALGAVRASAASGFSYLFDTWPLSDEIEAGRRLGVAVEAVYDAFNAPPFLDWLRRLTGEPRIAYCDAQATRYLPGHFLTTHDDGVEGKHRLFAYVLNLTPAWRTDWGGLLLFPDGDGHVAEGYTPAFNALNLFRTPQPHLVTEVASYAPAPRLAVTGWVRSQQG